MTKPTAHREFWIDLDIETGELRYIGNGADSEAGVRRNAGANYTFDPDDKNLGSEVIRAIEYSAVKDLLDALESIAHMRCSWKLSQEIAKAALTKFREGKAR